MSIFIPHPAHQVPHVSTFLLGAVQETPEPTLYMQAWHSQAISLKSPAEEAKNCQIPPATPNMFEEIRKTPFKEVCQQGKFDKLHLDFFYLREVNESNPLLWEQGLQGLHWSQICPLAAL